MKMSCPKIVKSDRMPTEIADHGNNSLGGSLKSKLLSGSGESGKSDPHPDRTIKCSHLRSLDGGMKPEPKPSAQKLPEWRAPTEEEMFYARATGKSHLLIKQYD